MTSQKIGFFGGTFDPIHFGHISLALHMLEREGLDQIFVCPARVSPHKEEELPISPEHRREMVKIAIAPIEKFHLIDLELDRPPPSYTIDTLEELRRRLPDATFRLIIGQDALDALSSWREIERILQIAPPLVGVRSMQVALKEPVINKLLSGNILTTPIMEISSREIRQRLKQKRFCGHLLPAKVLDYIYQHHLYY